MRGQIASVRYSHPAYLKTICFRCKKWESDVLNPSRMGFCEGKVITAKTKCEKYQPKEDYQ